MDGSIRIKGEEKRVMLGTRDSQNRGTDRQTDRRMGCGGQEGSCLT